MDKEQKWIKRKISDNYYGECIVSLINLLPKNKYDAVYGIPRGGVIPAVWLSYQMDISLLMEYGIWHIPKERILIIDDIVDTGETILPFVDMGYDTASIFYKSRSIVTPKYYVNCVDNYWIQFPYERDEEKINREFWFD